MLTELVDYNYYSKNYGGSSIPESSFKNFVIRASREINYYTFNRITEKNINDTIKDLACEIMELLFEQESLKEKTINYDESDKEIASETLGPRSISYVNKYGEQTKLIKSTEDLDMDIYKKCYKALVHTGLMYRGKYSDE